MFTGIVEEIGTVGGIRKQGQSMVIVIEANKVLEDVHVGDSISVNGVCLTVVAFDARSVAMDVVPETFRRSALRGLAIGSPVNLERAMAAGGRFGGHFVQGHVDGVGRIVSREPEETAVIFTIAPESRELMDGIIPKGSVAIDGISLTVASRSDASFSISIIPHTLAQTVLREKRAGDAVNIECDMIGKYITQLLEARGVIAPGAGSKSEGITLAKLSEYGFA